MEGRCEVIPSDVDVTLALVSDCSARWELLQVLPSEPGRSPTAALFGGGGVSITEST